MKPRTRFLPAVFVGRWNESYANLIADLQTASDRAVVELIKQQYSSGLRVKPIHPEKYYLEARISSGHRIIFRIEKGTIYFVDVVSHDDISRYGRRPRGTP